METPDEYADGATRAAGRRTTRELAEWLMAIDCGDITPTNGDDRDCLLVDVFVAITTLSNRHPECAAAVAAYKDTIFGGEHDGAPNPVSRIEQLVAAIPNEAM